MDHNNNFLSSSEQQQTSEHNKQTRTVPPLDYRINQYLSWILRGGVIISASIIIFGILLLALQTGNFSLGSIFYFPRTIPELVSHLLAFQSLAFITLGIFILIITPIIRIAASLVIFMIEQDKLYILITLIVLLIVLSSLFFGDKATTPEPQISTQIQLSWLVLLLITLGSILAGIVGSLVGLGGAILLTPLLTLVFHVPIEFAIGTGAIAIIATSSGAAATYVRDRLTNLRLGMFLELATTVGSITGAIITGLLAPWLLSIFFGIILLFSVAPQIFKLAEELPTGVKDDRWSRILNLANSYPDAKLKREVSYQVTNTPWGMAMMYIAGVISGLLGIGSGAFKVIAMDTLMRVPLKVSTTTSNFMMGATAAASAGIYLARGSILPLIAAPVALGVLIGALIGSRLLVRMSNKSLRLILIPIIAIIALQMIAKGLGF